MQKANRSSRYIIILTASVLQAAAGCGGEGEGRMARSRPVAATSADACDTTADCRIRYSAAVDCVDSRTEHSWCACGSAADPCDQTSVASAPATHGIGRVLVVDAASDQPVRELRSGDTLMRAALPRAFSLIAETTVAVSERVCFELDGVNVRCETNEPYAVSGDNNGDIAAWGVTDGQHTVRMRVDGRPAYDLSFVLAPSGPTVATVPDPQFSQPASQASATLYLVDAGANVRVRPIVDGDVLDLAKLPPSWSIEAALPSAVSGKVCFEVNSVQIRCEGAVPYAIAGDSNGDFYGWDPGPGSYDIAVLVGGSSPIVRKLVVMGAVAPQPVRPQPGPSARVVGRIAVSSDGNQHDKDDIGATAMTLALLAKAGLQSKLVYYGHSDHIWDTSLSQENEMIISTEEGAARLGFNKAIIYNAFRQTSAAVQAIANAVDVSSAADPLHFILAGPMEVAWRGIAASNSSKRQYVTIYSHSSWNDNHACREHTGHCWSDLLALGVKGDHLVDQNSYAFGARPQSAFSWLNNGGSDYQWLYTRLRFKDGDASDAGMAYYLMTGNQRPTMVEVRAFFSL